MKQSTGKERIFLTLNCETTDRPPLYDLIRNDAVIEYYSSASLNIDDPTPIVYSAYNKALDATKQNIMIPKKEEILDRDGKKFQQKRWTRWEITKEEYQHENITSKLKAQILQWQNACSQPEAKEAAKALFDDLNYKQSTMPEITLFLAGSCGGPYTLTDVCGGFEAMSYLMADEPDLISQACEVLFEYTLQMVNRWPTQDITSIVLIAEDIAFKQGLVFSPAFLRREFFPRLKRIVSEYHRKGFKVAFHSDGNLMEIMDDLVDCGIDALHPVEVMAGMNLKELRTRYPKLVLMGGIDCSQLLPFGSPQEIRETVLEAIRDTRYGYFVGSSAELHNEIPLENALAMYETVRKIV